MNAAIDAMNLAKEAMGMIPAKAAFGTASVLLTMIRVGFLSSYINRLLADVHRTP